MAAAAWTTTRKASSSNKAALLTSCVPAGGVTGDDDDKQRKIRVPKGYLPIVLVHGDDDDDEGGAGTTTETWVLVRVSDLKEPCMAALLEAAEEQGYGQQGVLKVPCDAQRFDLVLSMARKSKV
jgi:SAUR family protein